MGTSIVAMDSTLTCLVPPELCGTLLGINGITWAISGTVAPSCAAHLFKHHGFSAVPATGALILGFATVLTMVWEANPLRDSTEETFDEVVDDTKEEVQKYESSCSTRV